MIDNAKQFASVVGALGSLTSVGLIVWQILSGAFSFVYQTRDDISYLKSGFAEMQREIVEIKNVVTEKKKEQTK